MVLPSSNGAKCVMSTRLEIRIRLFKVDIDYGITVKPLKENTLRFIGTYKL